MKIALQVGTVAVAFALTLPVAAIAQYTGVSHPDETPITNSPEAPQPPVYQPLPAPQPSLKPRPGIPMETTAQPARASVPAMHVTEPIPSEVADARLPNSDDRIVMEVSGPANQLPVGTMIKVRLDHQISTETTASGTTFTAQLTEPVERNGRVLLPAGSTLSGLVTDIHGGKRATGAASIHLRTMSVTLPDGTKYQVRGQVVDTSLSQEVKVDEEGTILRRGHPGKTAATMGLTAGSGAAAGAMIAGVPGAVVGAGVGVGVSTVVWLKQDRQVDLPGETKVTFWLTEPLMVGGA